MSATREVRNGQERVLKVPCNAIKPDDNGALVEDNNDRGGSAEGVLLTKKGL